VRKPSYTPATKKLTLRLYQEEPPAGVKLSRYIEIHEDRRKLFKRKGRIVVGVQASGSGDWDGAIEFKRPDYSEMARGNAVEVVKSVHADVAFNREVLDSKRYDYEVLVDGFDPRGIDGALMNNFPIHAVWTHTFDGTPSSRIFSRDCLEVELELPRSKMLYMLCNHFKIRGSGSRAGNDAPRHRQAERVPEILGKDLLVVAGDLNDSPDSTPEDPQAALGHPRVESGLMGGAE
jgi:hypothetical protein